MQKECPWLEAFWPKMALEDEWRSNTCVDTIYGMQRVLFALRQAFCPKMALEAAWISFLMQISDSMQQRVFFAGGGVLFCMQPRAGRGSPIYGR